MFCLFIALLAIITILLIWNIVTVKIKNNKEKEYNELNAKLNYITATGSVIIILIGYLGYNNEQNLNTANENKIKSFFVGKAEELQKQNGTQIDSFMAKKSTKIDSLINSKDILKAGVYIVNDLDFIEGKEYKFEDLKTIDNKNLPKFLYPPKLIINTSTGQNLRIKKVTESSFILSSPIPPRQSFWADTTNPNYPKVVKFDVWIANYKSK